jgi:hypothetical protein
VPTTLNLIEVKILKYLNVPLGHSATWGSVPGWWLTASNRNMNPGNIRVESDGAKIVVTVEK